MSIEKLLAFCIVALTLVACDQTEKQAPTVEESQDKTATMKDTVITQSVEDFQDLSFPLWLRKKYPIDTHPYIPDGSYGIVNFVAINKDVRWVIVEEHSGVGFSTQLTTFLDTVAVETVYIGQMFDNPNPEMGDKYTDYQQLNDTFFLSTTYVEEAPDSILELYMTGSEIPDFEFYRDTLIDTIIIKDNGSILKY